MVEENSRDIDFYQIHVDLFTNLMQIITRHLIRISKLRLRNVIYFKMALVYNVEASWSNLY